MLKVGDAAPDFKIGDTTLHRMLETRSVAVFFFPKAFTPGCTREAGAFGQEFGGLRMSGCDVVGVSGDDQETNDRFRESLGLPFPVVGDPDGAILRAYRVRWPMVGLARRVTYLIDGSRKVKLAVHAEFDVGQHVSRTCALVRRSRS
jgi:peroxiredoxin